MSHTANLAIQFLPLHKEQEEAYAIIDAAIAVIQKSGLRYEVCPFETVVEGPYEQLLALLNDMQEAAYGAGAESLLINMKLHRSRVRDLKIDDKIGKYRS